MDQWLKDYRKHVQGKSGDPLGDLHGRLPYRKLRVLEKLDFLKSRPKYVPNPVQPVSISAKLCSLFNSTFYHTYQNSSLQ